MIEIQWIAVLTSLLILLIGVLLSMRISPPKSVWGRVAFIFVIYIVFYIGVNTDIISIFGVSLKLGHLLHSFGLGLLFGYFVFKK